VQWFRRELKTVFTRFFPTAGPCFVAGEKYEDGQVNELKPDQG